MSGLTSRQLVERTLAGLDTPRAPAGPLAVHYCAALAGVSLRDYTLNPKVLADCVLRYHEQFRPDAVWLSADTWVTAQAMGAPVAFPGENQPLGGTGRPLVQSLADVERIPPPDPSRQGRWPLMLEALQRLRAGLGPEVFLVACFDQYPFSLACALLGLENALLLALEGSHLLDRLMARGAEYAIAYASALAAAGADMLSGGDSPAGLLGPALYRTIALPGEQQVIAALRARHPQPVSLHICGNATALLPDMARAGAGVLELDHQVDLAAALRVIRPETTLWGNLDPVGVLARGTPQDVRQAARAALQTAASFRPGRFVLSSGCTLALETPAANLACLLQTARE